MYGILFFLKTLYMDNYKSAPVISGEEEPGELFYISETLQPLAGEGIGIL